MLDVSVSIRSITSIFSILLLIDGDHNGHFPKLPENTRDNLSTAHSTQDVVNEKLFGHQAAFISFYQYSSKPNGK